jgi:EmrB/QacA subfamily drug resistance transporter
LSEIEVSTLSAQDNNNKSYANGFDSLTKREMVGTIVGLQLTLLLAALDQTIIATAMPRIIAQLNGFERYGWVSTAYLLTVTASIPIFGRISDLFGRKWVLLLGAFFFVLTSALCGAAGEFPLGPLDGMGQLILFRGLQGIGGGVIMVVVFSALGDLFPPAVRGKYMGLFSGIWALASLLGPTLGGWLTDVYSWRAIFYINLPVGVVACLALYHFFPYRAPKGARPKIDYLGAVMLVLFLLPFLVGLNNASANGIQSLSAFGPLLFSGVMAAIFTWVEKRAAEPIIPPVLLGIREIQLALFVFLSVSIGMFSVTLFVPLFMQVVMDLSPTLAGSLFTPLTLGMAAAATTSGQLMSRLGRYKPLAIIGLAIATTSVFALSRFDAHVSNTVLVETLIAIGIGLGMTFPIFTISAQNAAPPGMIGAATALVQFMRSVGGTIGAAAMGSLMQAKYLEQLHSQTLPAMSETLAIELNNPTRLMQSKQALIASPAGNIDRLAEYNQLSHFASQALVHALGIVFLVSAVLLGLAFLASFLIEEKPLRAK